MASRKIRVLLSGQGWTSGSPELIMDVQCLTCKSLMLCMDRFLYHGFLSICKGTNRISNFCGTFVNTCKLTQTFLVMCSFHCCRGIWHTTFSKWESCITSDFRNFVNYRFVYHLPRAQSKVWARRQNWLKLKMPPRSQHKWQLPIILLTATLSKLSN